MRVVDTPIWSFALRRRRDRRTPEEDETLATEDFEEAARCGNRCRAAGIAGSTVDYLTCVAAPRRGAPIYTTDGDFALYARHLPIRLHQPELESR